MFDLRPCVQPVRKENSHVGLCCYYPFACGGCLKPREPLAKLQPFRSVFQHFLSPSHTGAKDEYNSIEGLLAPVQDCALRPLSGRYLVALAAGQRSPKWSPLVLGIDTISISDTSSSPLFVVGSSVSCLQYDPGRLSPLKIRRRTTSAAARFSRKGLLPANRRSAGAGPLHAQEVLFHSTVLQVAFVGYVGGLVESCASTDEQSVFLSA